MESTGVADVVDTAIKGDSSSSLTSSNSDEILLSHPVTNINLPSFGGGSGGNAAINLTWASTNTPQVAGQNVGVGGHKLLTSSPFANAAIAEAAAGK